MPVALTWAEPARAGSDSWSSPEAAQRVLVWMHANADDDHEVVASRRVVGAALKMSDATARRALRRLEDHGEITIVRRGTGERWGSRFRLREHGITSDPSSVA